MPQEPQPEAQLFVTCIVDSLFPAVGEATVTVLERLGVNVHFPLAQTCCGQPGYNAGFRREARQLALTTLEAFEASPAPVVTPSGSCAAMLVHGYPDLFANEPENLARARQLAARTYELSQYLTQVLKVDAHAFGPAGALGGRLAYHASCHLSRGLGVNAAPSLLAGVPDVRLTPLAGADECCGFGGLFSVKHAGVSAAMLDRKLAAIAASGAERVTACDMSCLMHIQGGLQRDGSSVQCLHLAQVLAGALVEPGAEAPA